MKFAGSKLELYLLKSELKRVGSGDCFLYEKMRLSDTEKLLSEIHNRFAIRRVRKAVSYKRM